MARRKRKKQASSIFGALVIEGLALVVFVFLFAQARAERQAEDSTGHEAIPVLQGMFEQTPFYDIVAQNEIQQRPTSGPSNGLNF